MAEFGSDFSDYPTQELEFRTNAGPLCWKYTRIPGVLPIKQYLWGGRGYRVYD